MAVIDYEPRGNGTICSVANLSLPVSAGDEYLTLDYGSASLETDITVGTGLMIESEFCSVREVIGAKIRVSRGCADSIPKAHLAGRPVWFFSDDVGSDRREYLTGDVVTVKVLMKTSTRSMGIGESPPNALPMVGRFARPYPPGQVFIGATPFHQVVRLDNASPVADITWAHRYRESQGDQLIGHEVGSISPEVGTTYTVRAYTAGGALKRTLSGIEGTLASYTLGDAVADLGIAVGAPDDVAGYLTLQTVRGGFTSLESYRIDFVANASAIAGGWGYAWGYAWGG